MKKFHIKTVALLVAGTALFGSCRKDPVITDAGMVAAEEASVSFKVPAGWPAPRYSFADNPLTPEGFKLGRALFYEPMLSLDSTVSCGFCHQAPAAFANATHAVSHGVHDAVGTRNAQGLFNLAWSPAFMWDGGVVGLENQPIVPIQHPNEMALPIAQALARLSASPQYVEQFEKVFGPGGVTYQRLARALAQFMAVMISADSKWDRVTAGTASFTAEEASGAAIFRQACQNCHQPPLFTDFSFRNNGLLPSRVNDSGRAHITHDPADLYKFIVPSLRNVAYTAPYFHDGRAATLGQALAHYTDTVARRTLPGTDPALQHVMPLSPQQANDLAAFLRTLSDPAFIANTAFHEPQR